MCTASTVTGGCNYVTLASRFWAPSGGAAGQQCSGWPRDGPEKIRLTGLSHLTIPHTAAAREQGSDRSDLG